LLAGLIQPKQFFTPVLNFATSPGEIVYQTQNGTIFQIGQLYFVRIEIEIYYSSGIVTQPTGQIYIIGCPYPESFPTEPGQPPTIGQPFPTAVLNVLNNNYLNLTGVTLNPTSNIYSFGCEMSRRKLNVGDPFYQHPHISIVINPSNAVAKTYLKGEHLQNRSRIEIGGFYF